MNKIYNVYDLEGKTIVSKETSPNGIIGYLYESGIIKNLEHREIVYKKNKKSGSIAMPRRIEREDIKPRIDFLKKKLKTQGCLCFDDSDNLLDYPTPGYFSRYIILNMERKDIPKILLVKTKCAKFRKIRLNKLLKYFENEDGSDNNSDDGDGDGDDRI